MSLSLRIGDCRMSEWSGLKCLSMVKLTDLSNHRATMVRYCPVSFSAFSPTPKMDYQLGVFEETNQSGQPLSNRPRSNGCSSICIGRGNSTTSRQR